MLFDLLPKEETQMPDMGTRATADWRVREGEVIECMRQSFSTDIWLEYSFVSVYFSIFSL
jgi:hypothetical protein